MQSNRTARPLAARRQDEILKRVAATGSASVGELAQFFGMSRETIRRDLRILAERGRLDIVHGGALRREATEPALAERLAENAEGKAAIGRTAAALVQDGMVVLLDSGTTTLAVAQALAMKRDLTVCTTSLAIGQLLCRVAGNRVHMLGGEIDPNEEATLGLDAIEAIARFRVDLAFVGGGGLSPSGELTDYSREAAEQRSKMIASAAKAYFVLDRTKFARLTPIRIPRFADATAMIVDEAPPPPLRDGLARIGLRMIVAERT